MPDTNRPLKLFLSYASQDKFLVRKLSERLAREKWIDPWVDEKKLLPGQDWRLKIEEAVETSDIVIICLSTNSVSKEGFVQKELRYAKEISLEKPEETIFLIPLRLDDCEPPRGLRFFQWADYFGDKQEETYQALLQSLNLRYTQKLKYEAEERAHQEKLKSEQEAVERIAAEKARQAIAERIDLEKKERETAQKVEQERKERQTSEMLAREREKQAKIEKSRREKQEQQSVYRAALIKRVTDAKPVLRVMVIVGSGVLLSSFLIGLIYNNVLKNLIYPAQTPTNPSTVISTATIQLPTLTPTVLPSPTITPIPLLVNITDDKGVDMVLVPEDYFTMGDEKYDNEKPAHEVYLESYYIDVYEVTNASYKVCEDEGMCVSPQKKSSANQDDYYGNSKFDNYPVVYVDWNMARTYCEWRKALLPTEAVWEKAARGAETPSNVFPWGNEIDETFANYNQNIGDTTAVGTYKKGKSIYGAYDMGGNVWEWVSSLYMPYPYNAIDGREDFNATGSRTLRGGSWLNIADNLRVTGRLRAGATNTSSYVGFRCYRLP